MEFGIREESLTLIIFIDNVRSGQCTRIRRVPVVIARESTKVSWKMGKNHRRFRADMEDTDAVHRCRSDVGKGWNRV